MYVRPHYNSRQISGGIVEGFLPFPVMYLILHHIIEEKEKEQIL